MASERQIELQRQIEAQLTEEIGKCETFRQEVERNPGLHSPQVVQQESQRCLQLIAQRRRVREAIAAMENQQARGDTRADPVYPDPDQGDVVDVPETAEEEGAVVSGSGTGGGAGTTGGEGPPPVPPGLFGGDASGGQGGFGSAPGTVPSFVPGTPGPGTPAPPVQTPVSGGALSRVVTWLAAQALLRPELWRSIFSEILRRIGQRGANGLSARACVELFSRKLDEDQKMALLAYWCDDESAAGMMLENKAQMRYYDVLRLSTTPMSFDPATGACSCAPSVMGAPSPGFGAQGMTGGQVSVSANQALGESIERGINALNPWRDIDLPGSIPG